jgi:ATP-dependent Lon protease
MGKESALVFTTGYQVNLATCAALLSNKQSVAFIDRNVHASLYDGVRLGQAAGAKLVRYKHNDAESLDRALHLHVPAGAVPKDGPSAGVTMVTALSSLATGRPVRSDVGMTGEVTLNGRVLPIGGVKQKLLAAQRAGVTTVFIPARNEPDLDDVPAEVLAALSVHPVSDVAQILALALEPAAGAVDSTDDAVIAAA